MRVGEIVSNIIEKNLILHLFCYKFLYRIELRQVYEFFLVSHEKFLLSDESEVMKETSDGTAATLSDVGEQVQHAFVLLLASSLAEDVPEPQRLVTRAGDDGLAVGAQGKVKHSI